MMLVGREAEIAVLDAMLRDCRQGKGAVAVIRGPTASGKTALLQAFAERAAAEALILGAVASRAERGLPLRILGQLLVDCPLSATATRRLTELIERAARTDPQGEPGRETVSQVPERVCEELLRALLELSAGRPVVIAVDDLPQVDLASLQCLSYIARRAGSARILIVLTECAGILPADRLIHAEILHQGNCRCIPLGPLPPTEVAVVLGEHLDLSTASRLAGACHAITGGNPLLVRALGADSLVTADGPVRLIPGSAFGSAIATCLHRHDPETVELAQAVAVLGESATTALLSELLDLAPESAAQRINALGMSGLLESGEFRHVAARQAVLDHMTADERAAMHGRVARVLYRAGAPAAILASHLMEAHGIRFRWAVPALRDAAERALAEGEVGRAIGYLRRAEDECADDRQRAAIRFMLVGAEWLINPEGAARHLSDLVADARASRLGDEHLGMLVYYLLWTGDTGSVAEVLAVLDAKRDDMARSPLRFLYPDLARGTFSAAEPARAAALPATVADSYEATFVAAEKILRERKLNDPTLASATTALLMLICEDMLDRAAFWCDVLMREPAARSSPLWRAVLTSLRAMIETRWGNLLAAENHARAALDMLTMKAWGVAIGAPLSCLLLTTTARRRDEDAAACLRVPVPEAMFGTPYGLLYLHARGEYYLAAGHAQAALADFVDCGNRMTAWGIDQPGLVPWRVKAAEAHLMMGDNHKASELSRQQLAGVGTRCARIRGISLRALALTSHPSKRTALLRESAEALRDSGATLELAYTFTELSNAHLALGEHSRAQWAARQARNLAERCGAKTLKIALGKTELDAGEPGHGIDKRLLSQLSDAEQRVAMLAAYGYTNTQIAHKLYITVSTVEQHLTRVYRKLGVAGRAELPIGI
jgi:DNA-binding CsgD family transcriptional regulator